MQTSRSIVLLFLRTTLTTFEFGLLVFVSLVKDEKNPKVLSNVPCDGLLSFICFILSIDGE